MIEYFEFGRWLISQLRKIWKAIRHWRAEKDSIATRFIFIFEINGVHRNQIPKILGHGLSVSDLVSVEALLPKLTEEVLDATSKMFAIRREWLDGADSQIYPTHDFYKWPERFIEFIEKLRKENRGAPLSGYLLIPAELARGAPALIILQETIAFIGSKPIYRLHLCNNWLYTYWKAKAYLTSCIASAWCREVDIYCAEIPSSEIKSYQFGETPLGFNGDGIGHFNRYPRVVAYKWALEPEAFLAGVDPERDGFGTRSALELWLELDKAGLMKTHFPAVGVREHFIAELERHSQER